MRSCFTNVDSTCWAVVHGGCYVTIIVYLHHNPSLCQSLEQCLLCNDHCGPRFNKYDSCLFWDNKDSTCWRWVGNGTRMKLAWEKRKHISVRIRCVVSFFVFCQANLILVPRFQLTVIKYRQFQDSCLQMSIVTAHLSFIFCEGWSPGSCIVNLWIS